MVLSLAIASAVSLGIADFLAGETIRRDGRTESAVLYSFLGALIGAIVVLAALPLAPPEHFAADDVAWSIAAGIAIGVALPVLMVGMGRGPAAVVAPVLGLVTIAVPAVAGPLLGDHLSGWEVAGLLVAFPAAGLVSTSAHQSDTSASVRKAVVFGAVAGFFFGSAAVCFGQTSTDSGIAPGVVAQATTTALLAVAMLAMGRVVRPRRVAVRLAAIVGGLTAIAVFLSVLAYQRGPVAVVAAVIGLAPGPTVLLAWLWTRERISGLQMVGFALGVVAVVLFAIG